MTQRWIAGLFLALFSSAGLAQNEDFVAVVDLKYLKETERVVAVMCYTPDECSPWANGYLFEGRVRKVISGQAPNRKFLVIYGQHALKKADLRGITGSFSKLTDDKEGAEYQLARRAVAGNLTCFRWWGPDGTGPVDPPKSGKLLQCFDPEDPETTVEKSSPLHDPEKTLRAANEAYNQALIDGDVPALDKIFASEFIYTSTSAEVLDKAAQLLLFKSNTLDIASGVGSEESMQIHGKTGIVVGRFDAKGTYAGKPFDSTERYTSVWVVRGDRWQLVAEQGTLVPAKAGRIP